MKLFSQEPTGVESFDGGAQKRLAQRILQEIRTPSEFRDAKGNEHEHSTVIALEGSWGSGKSNVLKMVQADILKDSSACYVNYDVWAHRQELTRKSILEEIVGDLVKREIVSKKLLPRLYAITSESVSKYIETIDKFQWMSAIAVLCLIIVEYLTKCEIPLPKALLYVLVLTLFGSFIFNLFYIGSGFVGALERIVMALKLQSPFQSNIEIVHKKDTTVEDFRDFIRDLSKELWNNKKGKGDVKGKPYGLVIVFDNLDRLEVDEIRCFWGAVHVLFAEEKSNRPSNVQIIIPYDRSRIRNAFGNQESGDEVIRKTVDVVFNLPPNILVDRAKFLKERLSDAFDSKPFVADADIDMAIKIFDWLHEDDDLTPRALISYVNELAVQYSVIEQNITCQEDNIPLAYVALFVLGWRRFDCRKVSPKCKLVKEQPKKSAENTGESFDKDKLLVDLNNRDMHIISGTFLIQKSKAAWKWYLSQVGRSSIYMAAVIYQLPIKRTGEVLLYQNLGVALDSGDAVTMKRLSAIPGFHRVFSTIIQQIRNFEHSCKALEGIDTSDAQDYWDEFYDTRRDEIIDAHSSISILHDGEALLIQRISRWQDYYMQLVAKMSNDKNAMFNENIEVQFAKAVEKELNKSGRTLLGNFTHAPLPPDKFLALARAAQNDFPLMNCRCDTVQMENYVLPHVRNNISNLCDGLQFLEINILKAMPHLWALISQKQAEDGVPDAMQSIVTQIMNRYHEGK